ncbi:MAG: hypothetical protein HDT26_10690 [Subdoligranulum sp.]|nr:hypothetical protein [Subdoligranulum sp.]
MQITSTAAAANRVSYSNAAVSDNHATSQDFLSVMNAAYDTAASPEIPKAEANVSAAQITPLEQYEMITGRTVAGEEPPAAAQCRWNDDGFARLTAGQFTGDLNYPIDTTKTINWASSGDHKLTAEEIAQLKEKYDVTNLSAQEYYDLMSDLTHMNVLSAEDVMSVHLKHGGDGFVMTPGGGGFASWGKIPTLQQGNIVKYLADWLALLLEKWDWLHSDDFKEANTHLGAEAPGSWGEAVQIDIELAQKMQSVMQQLQ